MTPRPPTSTPLSLHDALPISNLRSLTMNLVAVLSVAVSIVLSAVAPAGAHAFLERADPRVGSTTKTPRSEEHTSELQSRRDLVCRLLLEKKKTNSNVVTQ